MRGLQGKLYPQNEPGVSQGKKVKGTLREEVEDRE